MFPDPTWIIPFRNEYLTAFFKFFPFLASNYFYITVIAMGYWLGIKRMLFIHLAFLVPFSTLINSILKASFKIPRPPEYLHLIPVDNSFGFPSGDAQVATVFWGYIFFTFRKNPLHYVCLVPIILIAISRVYLGVHSIYDVLFGVIFGLLIIVIWNIQYIKNFYKNWYNNKVLSFWLLLCTMVAIYSLITPHIIWPKVVPIVIGALIGYGLSLKQIGKDLVVSPQNYNIKRLIISLLSLSILISLVIMTPIPMAHSIITHLAFIIKYAFIIIAIFVLVPKVQSKLAVSS